MVVDASELDNPILGLFFMLSFLVSILMIAPVLPSISYSVTVDDVSIHSSESYASNMNAYEAYIGFSPFSPDKQGNKRVNITIRSPESNEVVKHETKSFDGTFSQTNSVRGDIHMREDGPFVVEIEYQEFESNTGWRTLDSESIDLAYS